MTEYTPTTEEVRERWRRFYSQPVFDAWLAAHDREAAARAWDEGYTVGNAHNGRRDACPYRDVEEAQR